MLRGTNILLVMTAAAALSAPAPVAWAQSTTELQKQEDKRSKDYQPKGLPAGSFDIFPSIDIDETYNSNIFKTTNNEDSDFITKISPKLSVRSDWNRHALNLKAGGAFGIYADKSDDDYTDYDVSGDTRLDVTNALEITGKAKFRHGHEDRGGDDVGTDASEPVEFDRIDAGIGAKYAPGRVSISGGVDFSIYDYDDNGTIAGGISNNDDRDRNVMKTNLKLGYEIQEGYEAFVRGEYNDRNYDDAVDDNGLNRDSDGYKVQAGMAVDLTNLIRGELGLGYFEQNHDEATFSSTDGFSADGNVRWSITSLTTLRGSVSRSQNETTTNNVSTTLATNFGVGIDHEFLRNFTVKGDVKFANSEFQGAADNREDDTITTSASAQYLFNRYLVGSVRAQYADRDSTIDANDYDQLQVGARIGLRY